MPLLEVVAPVFLIIGAGYIMERRTRLDLATLSQLSLYLFAPALVLDALLAHPLPGRDISLILLYMLVYMAVLLGVGWLTAALCGFQETVRRAWLLATSMMNVGNMGLPLVLFAFGEQARPLAVAVFVVFNIPLGSLAIVIAQPGRTQISTTVKETLRIPILHAVVLAFALQYWNVAPPVPVQRLLHLLGQAAVPVMLVLLGIQLGRTAWQAAWGFVTASSMVRLLGGPLLAWGITSALGIEGLLQQVLILQTATPSAVLPLLYSMRFRTRPDLVAGSIFVSTFGSAVTLSLLIQLLPAAM